ncbi:MAG TPA: 1,4-alpha-glucan branching protein GlgB, partial [Thermoanaerobaculia bacterium]
QWNPRANFLEARGASGLWEGFIPGLHKGSVYKFHIVSLHNNYRVDKADPFGILHETPPRTASVVWDLEYEWNDSDWMESRKDRNSLNAPMSIYEVHLGSWRRTTDDGHTWRPMSYREIAHPLAEYVKKMNFTHIELLPIMEHPFYGSWGYQCTGFFAPTSRYGTPQDFKYFVDVMHQHGIGVILDWVPSHFPTDEHGIAYFDGTHLYEHADPRKGFHPDWGSLIFNYGRNEVRSFLLSSAMYWLEEYHGDGLRVDAVASMLYLDYSRKHGEWIPNDFGGRENVEAIAFLRQMNESVYKAHPDVQIIAEESTAWPMVSRPLYVGGLGFGMKWDMGWMHDTLRYFGNDPIHRKYHHNDLTFRMMYAFTENFVLPLSHDEVVHGKGSLIGKMPGDQWQKFANLRLLFAHMYSQPAKKLIFMGGEFGQVREWNHDAGLDFHLTDFVPHATLQRWVEDLNKAYRNIPALHELDTSPDGFEWIDCCDNENSVVSITRRSKSRPDEQLVIVLNFTPIPRHNYMIGVPNGGHWREILNSDATLYGGSGQGNLGGVDAVPIPLHARKWSVTLTLPPLGAIFLMSTPEKAEVVELDE